MCRFSHFKPDDPIVLPKFPGLSHNHTFFGNQSTNAFLDARLAEAGIDDMPARGGHGVVLGAHAARRRKQVSPDEAEVYYRRSTLARVRAFPAGLKVVAGNAKATTPLSLHTVFWNCSTDIGGATAAIPTCATPTLHVHVRFPNCWDGRHLDSADHKRHMAYSTGGRCPRTHPVAVPQLLLIIQYPIAGGRPPSSPRAGGSPATRTSSTPGSRPS